MERDCYFLRIRRKARAIETMLPPTLYCLCTAATTCSISGTVTAVMTSWIALAVFRGERLVPADRMAAGIGEILAACKYFGDEKAFPRL